MPNESRRDATMKAVVTTGTGGYERLSYRDVPIPEPGPGELLLKVLAAGLNATDINTRLGWYASEVTGGPREPDAGADERRDGGWNDATPFPLIQGTDVCGRVVAAGAPADRERVGERVLVRPCMRTHGFERMETRWLGSDMDGGFAEYVVVPEGEAFAVACDLSDAELATLPCAYGTAENMLERAGVAEGTRVLVPGASGGVGSAVAHLAKRRGAEVIAVTSVGKRDRVRSLGADRVLVRDEDPRDVLGTRSVDVVVDNVGGASFATMLELLRRGGRYVSSGAIAGPRVDLDLRAMYLGDLTLIGCTAWDAPVFPRLVSYVERGDVAPRLERTFPLADIVEAQRTFEAKEHVGQLVLVPPGGAPGPDREA